MLNTVSRFALVAATATFIVLAAAPPVGAFEQEPQNNIDPSKFSDAAKAAESKALGNQTGAPNFNNSDKTATGQGGSSDGAGVVIPGVNNKVGNGPDVNTGATFNPQQNNLKGVPGFDVSNTGAAGLNLPGSSYQHGPQDIDAITGKMKQDAAGVVDAASKGGVNSLNIPTSSAPGVKESDEGISGFFSGVWSSITGSGGGSGDNSRNDAKNSEKNTGSVTGSPDASTPLVNTGTPVDPNNGSNGLVNRGYPEGSFTGKQRGETLGAVIVNKPRYTPSDDSNTSANSGQLDARSGVARKNQGGGTDNNSEGSSGKTGGLSNNSSFVNRNHGDGGDDAGDNNHVSKSGSLASGTPLARKDYGDGGNSDSRGGTGATAKITGKVVGTGGGHNENVSTKSQIIGGGLLENDVNSSTQGPVATGTPAATAGSFNARTR